ncbi:CHASE2 domain-containing protein [Pseudomonas syringae]|nr:CHASE2 domain-containing protein [Pseudomonas syringae]
MSANTSLFSGRQYLLAALVVLMAVLDPFGLSTSSDDASARWLNRVFASSYNSIGQQQIAVVIIDDAYLLRNNTYWPMPYSAQSKLFKRLLSFEPKAVFVDLLYSHDHSLGDPAQGSQLLTRVFERYQRQGIGLSLANTGEVRGQNGQTNTLTPLAQVSTPALVSWSGLGDKYPLALKTPQGVMESPALALYREYCQGRTCAELPADGQAASQAPPMAVQWGFKLSPEQSKIADISDCATSSGVFIDVAKQLLRAVFWKLGSAAPTLCPYTLTLTASDLEVTSTEDRALITGLLKDRLVLVGANITSTADLVQSPVHGKIPGVYVHAMALDNLITLGMNYDRDPDSFPNVDINKLDLIELFLLGMIVLLKALHQRCRETQRGVNRWQGFRGWFFGRAWPSWLSVLLLLGLTSWALHRMHITPVNVLAVLLISLALFSEQAEARKG